MATGNTGGIPIPQIAVLTVVFFKNALIVSLIR
jgi:hypothetical protein